jgi:hypothetical membrane protein
MTVAVCSPTDRITKSLLGYGILAGPFYVVVSLAQALTRNGFDLRRHEWSLLANGPLGWIQILNFVLTGLMVVAASVGMQRSGRSAGRWLGVFGASLIAAGVFRADPVGGFPPGSGNDVSWHGVLHFVAAGIGFACMAIACFVVARVYAREGRREWAIGSRGVAILFLAGFVAVATSGGTEAANLGFTAGIILIWGWLSAVSALEYKEI